MLTQFLLLVTIVVHAMLGIRVLLIDIGLDVRREKIVLGIVALVGVLILVIVGRSVL